MVRQKHTKFTASILVGLPTTSSAVLMYLYLHTGSPGLRPVSPVNLPPVDFDFVGLTVLQIVKLHWADGGR